MKSIFWLSLIVLSLVVPARVTLGADTDHNFAKWENEVAAFEQSDATNPPPKGACLFIGSSTIRKWTTLAQDIPNQQVINRGFGGTEIVDSTHFADRIIYPYAPRVIFLRAGGNDLWGGKSVEQVFADFKEFVATVQARLPQTDIVFISLSPSIARWKQADKEKAVNNLVKGYIHGRPQLHYIETYPMVLGTDGKPRPELFVSDNLHFNAEGYKLLTKCVLAQWPILRKAKVFRSGFGVGQDKNNDPAKVP